mmetsp:Transcript_19568/g.52771  ORF Transcript_19568/g.52771 Transcript_19568/m.52771 type:complete len:292 (-) Transcript_19568:137-1012(-)
MVSARMKPRSKSPWMTPAACGAVHPCLIVHARVSVGPEVKYVRRPSRSYAARTSCLRPQSSTLTPRDSRNSSRSSWESSMSSASTWAETMTTDAPSAAATSESFLTMSLPSARSLSATFAAYIIFFAVKSCRRSSQTLSSSERDSKRLRAGCPSSSACSALASTSFSWGSVLRSLATRSRRFSTCARSEKMSSRLITSASRTGSTLPSTCTTLVSSKHRTTWTMASHSRMLARNWLPRPSPVDAPFTRPAMSTNSSVAGITFSDLLISSSILRRGSGTETIPTLGSIVQNG